MKWLPQEDDFRNFLEEFRNYCFSDEIKKMSLESSFFTQQYARQNMGQC